MEKSWSVTFTDLRGAWARQSGHLFKMCLERTWVESGFLSLSDKWATPGGQASVVPRRVDLVSVWCRTVLEAEGKLGQHISCVWWATGFQA